MRLIKTFAAGCAISAMTMAIGIPGYSAEWWVFLVAASVLYSLASSGE